MRLLSTPITVNSKFEEIRQSVCSKKNASWIPINLIKIGCILSKYMSINKTHLLTGLFFISAVLLILTGCNSYSNEEVRIQKLLNTLYHNYQNEHKKYYPSQSDSYNPGKGISKMSNDEAIMELLSYGDITFDSLYNRLYRADMSINRIAGYAKLAAQYPDEMKAKLVINHDEELMRKRAEIFGLIGGNVEGAFEIAAGIASSIDYSKETVIDFKLLLGLLRECLPSEKNDLLNIIKKCIDEREQHIKTISDSKEIPASFNFMNEFFQDERHNTSEKPSNNYLKQYFTRGWTLNEVEPLLLHLFRYNCDNRAIKILESKYHTPNQAIFQALFLRQIERRYYAAMEQGISHDKLFFPERIDRNPEIPSTLKKGGKKPGKGNVLIIENGFSRAMGSTYDYAYKEMPKWFPANRYAVSKSDLSVIILLYHSSNVVAYYSGGVSAVRKFTTVYAINVNEGRVFMEFGPIYGSMPETPDKISVASGTTGISGGDPSEVEITKAIDNILKNVIK